VWLFFVGCKTCRHKHFCLWRMVFHSTLEETNISSKRVLKYYNGRKIDLDAYASYNKNTL